MVRLANKARALVEAYRQASIVVPLGLPRRVPGNVVVDASSQWHVAGLWAAAVESVMLPARLKERRNMDTLEGMAEMLNPMGKQSIAGLQMSFAQVEEDEAKKGSGRKLTEEETTEGIELDMNFTPSDTIDSYGMRNGFNKRKPKVFSQLVSLRGYPEEEHEEEEPEVDQGERNLRRRRNPYEPITKRYVPIDTGPTSTNKTATTPNFASRCLTASPRFSDTRTAESP